MANGFRSRLKSNCGVSHRKLESQPRMQRLVDPELTDADYLEILLRFRVGFYALNRYLWTALRSCERFQPYIDQSCRLEVLKQDILKLEQSPRPLGTGQFDGPTSVPFGVGVLYVVMGSTLGGQLICRALASNRNENIRVAGQFFGGDPGERACLWRQFLEDLEDYAAESEVEHEVSFGANRAFDYLSDLFN